jgi:hypothetical protein
MLAGVGTDQPAVAPAATPLQVWLESARHLLGDAREELDDPAWITFLDIVAAWACREAVSAALRDERFRPAPRARRKAGSFVSRTARDASNRIRTREPAQPPEPPRTAQTRGWTDPAVAELADQERAG